ncbi:MAG: LptF/LptG family permease [Kiritimatiellae bacterium]|nr:LptF/LptG family permease [Kiritimatiellia bacterium]
MSILNRYVGIGYLVHLVGALVVFSVVMAIGSVVQAIDLVARGASAPVLARYMALNVPYILQYTLPMSVMTATLLQFTRLSLDGEITAMKACGLSLWQIASPVLLVATLVAALAMVVTQWVSPRSRLAQRVLLTQLAGEDPLQLIESGRWIRDFPGLLVYVGGRNGTHLTDIVIHQLDAANAVRLSIRARKGVVELSPEPPARLILDLYQVRMEEPDRRDPLNPLRARVMFAEHNRQTVDIAQLTRRSGVKRKISDFTGPELLAMIAGADAEPPLPEVVRRDQQARVLIEMNGRLAMSFSCLAMALVGIPLGLRSRRRESSVGVIVSLAVVFTFYFFLMMGRSMAGRPQLYPELWAWIPVVVAEAAGLWLIERSN